MADGPAINNEYRRAQQLFEQVGAAGDAEFLGQDAQRIFRGDKMNAGDALIGFKRAKCFAGKDCAGCAGDGEGEIQLLAPSF